MVKRIFLFMLTNIAIIALCSIIINIFGITPYLTQNGLNLESLFWFSLIFGFTGAFFSLFISKWMAKTAYKIQIIENPSGSHEVWLVNTVKTYADKMGVGMPEVGVYQNPEVNAFATGWNRNNSLVAFSSGILQRMNKDEIEGVIAHEVAHISNGDMITMSLLQGVINTFVIFFSRVAAYFVSSALRRDDNRGMSTMTFMLTSFVFEIIFGFMAQIIVCWFSRKREFRADADAAKNAGKTKMIAALQNLSKNIEAIDNTTSPQSATMKISSNKSILGLFTTHPPLEERIRKLQELNV